MVCYEAQHTKEKNYRPIPELQPGLIHPKKALPSKLAVTCQEHMGQ